jgi:hypothetical protein
MTIKEDYMIRSKISVRMHMVVGVGAMMAVRVGKWTQRVRMQPMRTRNEKNKQTSQFRQKHWRLKFAFLFPTQDE